MALLARVVAVDIPHHVTQRGNARRFILESDSDKLVYLDLLRQYCSWYELLLMGYCLMSNHVHLVVTPRKAESLPLALKHTHGRYAAYWNASHRSSGHAWQGRYDSCPLDLSHLWAALRYTELNPVRARMVSSPEGVPLVQRSPLTAALHSPKWCWILRCGRNTGVIEHGVSIFPNREPRPMRKQFGCAPIPDVRWEDRNLSRAWNRRRTAF